jgi:hypothetical protein
MSAERFVNGSLTLELRDEGPDVVVEWIGRSIARTPGSFVLPILMRAIEMAQKQKKRAVFDFRTLEYLNSSTITPVVRVLDHARRSSAHLTVRYNNDLKWQALAFSALFLFGTADGRVAIQGN